MPVDTRHVDYNLNMLSWLKCRDAHDGSDTIKAAGDRYLPYLVDQDEDQYEAYKQRALYYNATARTVQGLSGCVFRKPITVAVPDEVKPYLMDVTLDGVSFDQFCQKAFNEKLITNRYGVLVDFPSSEEVADDTARPYLVGYRAEQIINWKTERIGGRSVLSMVALEEKRPEPKADDPYVIDFVVQYRILTLEAGEYVARVYRKMEKGDDFELVSEYYPKRRGEQFTYIPFFFIGGTQEIDKPPLLDLVEVNLSHYRTSADLEHGRHYTALPTPWVAGFPAQTRLKIGSGVAWVATDPNAKAGMLEFTGQGLQALEKALEEKEQKMAALGARLLENTKRAAETAEAMKLRQSGEQSILQMMAQAASRTLTDVMTTFVEWAGGIAENVSVALNTEFFDAKLTPQELRELTLSWQAGGMSRRTYYYNLQRGDLARPDVDFEQEMEEISAELGGMPVVEPEVDPNAQAEIDGDNEA